MFQLTVISLLVASTFGYPQGYYSAPGGAPAPAPLPAPGNQYSQPPPSQYGAPQGPVECSNGEVRDPLGNCVQPEIIKDLFVFQEPADEDAGAPVGPLPKPKVKVNLVVIRTSDEGGEEPIVIPPPQEKTLVLVLSKKGDDSQQIIEVPAPAGQKPEVFFIDYAEGDNTLLPGGIYLQDALQSAAENNGNNGGNNNGGYQAPGQFGNQGSGGQFGSQQSSSGQFGNQGSGGQFGSQQSSSGQFGNQGFSGQFGGQPSYY